MHTLTQKHLMFPRVIAHRGASGHAPENTAAAFRLAKTHGARWVECDIQETQDGVLIVFHDDTLDRTTTGTGDVLATPWSTLQTLDAGSWFHPAFAGEKVLSLEQALLLFAELNLCANLEIKPAPGRDKDLALKIAKQVEHLWPKSLPAPLFSSFSIDALTAVREAFPTLNLGVLFDTLPADWLGIARRLAACSINVNASIANASFLAKAKENGYPVLAYTINDRTQANALFALGLTGVFTDFPWDATQDTFAVQRTP